MRTKFNGILTLLLAFVVQATFAQKTITGTVSDDMGPIPSASVMVKGTTNGTATDFDGKYSITAKAGDILVFSYAGMQSAEKTVGTANVINVTLGTNQLEEVVVTALGIKKSEKSIGYAAQVVKGDDLTRVRSTNITNSLSGKVAGINVTASNGGVNSSTRITIRGTSTLSGNDQPLVVVDGVPIDNNSYTDISSGKGVDSQNGMADINQDDIATMNVLKGGAATAIYGMRGANGVIVITTKSGKKSDALGITINSSVAFSNVYVLPDYQNSYGQGNNLNTFRYVDGYGNSSAATTGLGGLDESWGPALDRGLEFVQWNSFDGQPLPWVSAAGSAKNDFYQTGITTTNGVSFANRTDKADYRISFNLMNDKGVLYNTDLKRTNVGGKVNFDLSDKWKLGFSANYIKTTSDNSPSGGYDTSDNNNVISQLVWAARQVNWGDLRDYENLPLVQTGVNAGTPVNWNQAYNNNPFWMLDNNTNGLNKDRILGHVKMSYQFTDNLKASVRTGVDHFTSLNTRRAAKGTTGNIDGYYRETNRDVTEINTEALLQYNTKLTEKISLGLNIGANAMEKKYRYINREANALQLPNLYTLSNLKDGTTLESYNLTRRSKINSLFGFGSLSYNNYLFLEFSGRNDWASVLPLQNNSFFYPAASLSVIATDMVDGIKGDGLTYLKLRGGISKVGDAGPLNPYNLEPAYKYDSQSWGSTPVLYLPTRLWNPNIKNQDTKEIEFGLDARFIKNIFNLSATYYDKKTTDVILPKTVANSSGMYSVWQNAATITNKGVELSLGAKLWNKPADGFKLSTNINFGKNDNRVDDIDEDPTTDNGIYNLARQWSVSVQAREGEPLGVMYGSSYARDEEGNMIFRNGRAVQGPAKILGNSTADWTAGISFNASYKGFRLSTLFDGKKGGSVYSQTNFWGKYTGILAETAVGRETGIVGDGVMEDPANPGSYIKNTIVVSAKDYFQSTFNNSIGESGIYDASFIKWRELSLNYDIKKSVLKNSDLEAISVGVSVRNIAILFKNVPHIDPETGFSSSAANQGLEYAQIPSQRTVSFNLTLKF